MLNSDWLKPKLRLIFQDLRLIATFMQHAHSYTNGSSDSTAKLFKIRHPQIWQTRLYVVLRVDDRDVPSKPLLILLYSSYFTFIYSITYLHFISHIFSDEVKH